MRQGRQLEPAEYLRYRNIPGSSDEHGNWLTYLGAHISRGAQGHDRGAMARPLRRSVLPSASFC